ncbi:C1q-like domain-containing protein [Bacillus gaemokensis]|uniref:C1q-like domain-containing protein n=1 Tax=Bacillus gaemokensis TaxID=574375 RepID=UPI00068CB646|nr:hypothetical protein [Bacillus gaemokensis]
MAFRAVNFAAPQDVTANIPVQVQFPDFEFNVNSGYDPGTSRFFPSQNGVYSVIASIRFDPENITDNYSILIEIRLNDTTIAAEDNDFAFAGAINIISVAAILQLQTGDKLEVFVTSTVNGFIQRRRSATHFEAARFPSPI